MSAPDGIRWSWQRALLVIALTTFFCSGGAVATYFYWRYEREARCTDTRFMIAEFTSRCFYGQELSHEYLQSLLGLSKDRPTNLFAFNLRQGMETLQSSPLILHAELIKIPPNALVLHYAVREPVAALGDLDGALIDEEGVVFPKEPFFAERRFVTLHLGLKNKIVWGKPISNSRLRDAFNLLSLLEEKRLPVAEIDMSLAEEKSYGRREILVSLREPEHVVVRLFPRNLEALDDYLILRRQKFFHPETETIVDMRLPDLAYIR